MKPTSNRSAKSWAPLILILCFVFLSISFSGQFGRVLRFLYVARTLAFVFVANNYHCLTLCTIIFIAYSEQFEEGPWKHPASTRGADAHDNVMIIEATK